MSFTGRSIQRTWHLVDAKNQTVGRLAATVAPLLRGKHKPTFLPHTDCGDFVVVINCEKVNFTGKKWSEKLYRWHTGYPGGLKERPANEMLSRRPTEVLRRAILGMLNRNNLRGSYIEKRLKVYTGSSHPHLRQLTKEVKPLSPHPRKVNGSYHFGLKKYSPDGYRQEDVPDNWDKKSFGMK